MSSENNREEQTRDSAFIVMLQYLLPLSFTAAMSGVIIWIVSLIMLSRKLDDVPSVSMGISIVAIPVFLVLLSLFWYVFLGIIRNQESEDEPPHQEGVKNQPGGEG